MTTVCRCLELRHCHQRSRARTARSSGGSVRRTARSRTRAVWMGPGPTAANSMSAPACARRAAGSGSGCWSYHSDSRRWWRIRITAAAALHEGENWLRRRYCLEILTRLCFSTIRLPGDTRPAYGGNTGVMATLASVPWFVVGVAGIAYEWVASRADTHLFQSRRGYRNVPIDEDAQILRFEDEE